MFEEKYTLSRFACVIVMLILLLAGASNGATVSIQAAKQSPDGTSIEVCGMCSAVFSDCFYIETNDRIAALRVAHANTDICVGSLVDVVGVMSTRTSDGPEREVSGAEITVLGCGCNLLPLRVSCNVLNGLHSPNYVSGLLVTICGTVTYSSSGEMYVDDGSYVRDWPGHIGVKVIGPTPLGVLGENVSVTGIVAGGSPRFLRASCISDIHLLGCGEETSLSLHQGVNWIAPPLVPCNPNPTSVFSGIDLTKVKLSKWDMPTGKMIQYDPKCPDVFGGIISGVGYRIEVPSNINVPYTGFSLYNYDGTIDDVLISLIGSDSNGGVYWIGNPFNQDLSYGHCDDYWSDYLYQILVSDGQTIKTMDDAAAAGWMSATLNYWNNETQRYCSVGIGCDDDTLRIGRAYRLETFRNDLSLFLTPYSSYSVNNSPVSLPSTWASNAFASQRQDGSCVVDITYDLSGNRSNVLVSLLISNDGGATYDICPYHVTGDIGSGVHSGIHRNIIWNAGLDLPGGSWRKLSSKGYLLGFSF